MQQNFWEPGNLMKVNFREHLNSFLGNKGKTPIFSREQGKMYPPPPWEALLVSECQPNAAIEANKFIANQN